MSQDKKRNPNYKGNNYDPNYEQKKANRNYQKKHYEYKYQTTKNKSRSKGQSNYKGRHYNSNYKGRHYKPYYKKKTKFQRFYQSLLPLALIFVVFLIQQGLIEHFKNFNVQDYVNTNSVSMDDIEAVSSDLDISSEVVETSSNEVETSLEGLNEPELLVSNTKEINNDITNNTLISVNSCDTNGTREANVKVDVGYDSDLYNREYYAYTNNIGQLVKVEAATIKEQIDWEELPEGENRYCSAQADVDGAWENGYDRGHVIADSLGGVSNAYNITTQNSFVNQNGEQSVMEKQMQDTLYSGGTITNFVANIDYDDSSQTPVSYDVSYNVNGTPVNYQFANY